MFDRCINYQDVTLDYSNDLLNGCYDGAHKITSFKLFDFGFLSKLFTMFSYTCFREQTQ